MGIKFSQITGVAHFHLGAPPFNKTVVFWSPILKTKEIIFKNDTYFTVCSHTSEILAPSLCA